MTRTLGKVGDVPVGSVVAFEIDGKQVAVANVDSRLFAFDDVCTHRGCSLAKGSLDGDSVRCPCHGSVFHVTDGSVINGPATRPLGTYDVEVNGDDISISVDTSTTAGNGGGPTTETAPSSAPGPAGPEVPAPAGAADDKRVLAALASVPLFADLDQPSLVALAAFTFRKQFAAGELIMEEGHTGNGLYVLLSGSVEVVQGIPESKPRRLRLLGPGEPFGEIALLGDWKRSASVRAIDDVECIGMDRWAFLAHLKKEPALAIRMLQMVAGRLARVDPDADAGGEVVAG